MGADPKPGETGRLRADDVVKVTALGLAGVHPQEDDPAIHAAPVVGGGFNHVRRPFFPKACWRLEDAHFDFDSSVPIWSRFDVEPLELVLLEHPGAKLSVFGHADPTGREEYNTTLSGRRAQAIFALLTRKVAMWESLYSHHDTTTGKDEWGLKAINRMLEGLGFAPGTPSSSPSPDLTLAWHAFQDRHGVARTSLPSGDRADRATLKLLFADYMEKICGRVVLTDQDFIARGRGNHGKGDFQGCGEFNPIRIFSKDEAARFDQPAFKTERDQANEPNRRVMVLFFRPDTEVDPTLWPCPAVTDGPAACRKRFHADAKTRLENRGRRRENPGDRDTFACRFYDRLTDGSPCEGVRVPLKVRLLNSLRDPIPGAPYRITGDGGFAVTGVADERGWLLEDMIPAPSQCLVEWGYPGLSVDGDKPDQLRFFFSVAVTLRADTADRQAAAARRLQHLGYHRSKEFAENLLSFQRDYDVGKRDGNLDDDTDEALRRVHDLGQTRADLHPGQGT